jgi:hypothetical protein
MDIEKSLEYWSLKLNIPRNQFIRPYIKTSLIEGISHKGFKHGTCGVYVHSQYLKERILAGIDVIAKDITGIEKENLV